MNYDLPSFISMTKQLQPIEQMKKSSPKIRDPNFLPAIFNLTSMKTLKINQHLEKQNFNLDNLSHNRASRIIINSHPASLSKKHTLDTLPPQLEQLINNKLRPRQETPESMTQEYKQTIFPQINRPDTHTSQQKSTRSNFSHSYLIRRKSCHKSLPEQQSPRAFSIYKSTLKLPPTKFRSHSLPRDKIYSCKIAIKKGIFPMNSKKYQQAKIAEFFEEKSKISTIKENSEMDSQSIFISNPSYLNMDL